MSNHNLFAALQAALPQDIDTFALETVEADGRGTVKRVSIDPKVVNPADIEMLEDLVTVAMQEAQKKSREATEREMQKVTGGLGLGGLPFKLPF